MITSNNKCLQWTLKIAILYPFLFFDALTNLFVLYVLNADTEYHATYYLFKMLAITDIFNSVPYLISVMLDQESLHNLLARIFFVGHQRVNVHVSVLLALVRLSKVTPNLCGSHFFTRRRLRVALVVVVTWAMAVSYINVPVRKDICIPELIKDGRVDLADRLVVLETVLSDHIGLSIPALLEMIIMCLVLWRVRSYVRVRGNQVSERLRIMRRLDFTVLAICLSSFATYFILPVTITWVKIYTNREKQFKATLTFHILTAFNGIVNLAFYCLFIPRFRLLIGRRFAIWSMILTYGVSTIFPSALITPKSISLIPHTKSSLDSDVGDTQTALTSSCVEKQGTTSGQSDSLGQVIRAGD